MAFTSARSDAELVRRALGGSQNAYQALVQRFERPVLTVILRLVGDLALAEDLSQETFLKAFRHLARFDPERRLASWLFTIAHNTALDHLRRRRPSQVSIEASGEPAYEQEGLAIPAPAHLAPDLAAAGGELRSAVERALDGLRPAYREVLVLRLQEGLSYDEICAVTGLPMGTVKIHLHRARKRLAESLREAGFAVPAAGGGGSRRRARREAAETPPPAPA